MVPPNLTQKTICEYFKSPLHRHFHHRYNLHHLGQSYQPLRTLMERSLPSTSSASTPNRSGRRPNRSLTLSAWTWTFTRTPICLARSSCSSHPPRSFPSSRCQHRQAETEREERETHWLQATQVLKCSTKTHWLEELKSRYANVQLIWARLWERYT